MRLVDAHARLLRLGSPAFTTNDVAALLDVNGRNANAILTRLGEAGHVVRLTRGRWAIPDRIEPFALPESISAPVPSYVSLYSALHHHGMIEQIPAAVFAVTLGPTRRYATPLGEVSLHHVAPHFFFGFEQRGKGPKIAVPEKALVDTLYLRQARSRRFRALPELNLPRAFRPAAARRMVAKIASPSRRALVQDLLEDILGAP